MGAPASAPQKMTTRQIIQALRSRGFSLRLADNDSTRLQIAPAEHVTQELLQRLAPRKAALLKSLQNEQMAINVGRVVGTIQAEFPGSHAVDQGQNQDGDQDFERAWEAWRELTRRWWPDARPDERLERACEVLPDIINDLMAQPDDLAEARARYCWGRLEALTDMLQRKTGAAAR